MGYLNIARKKVDDLIAAFKIVIKNIPDAQLVIAGSGPDKELLITMAKGLPVEFLGYLSEEEKHEWYQRAWIFASPSSSEGFGITWIEANAHGLPVVIYDLGLDTVNETCAMLINMGDVDGLANGITKLLQNKVLIEDMGRAGKKNAARFDWSKTAEVFLDTIGAR